MVFDYRNATLTGQSTEDGFAPSVFENLPQAVTIRFVYQPPIDEGRTSSIHLSSLVFRHDGCFYRFGIISLPSGS